MPERSPFRTWNGIEAFEFVDGVRLHAIGGDQVLLCRVQYEPGKQVARHATSTPSSSWPSSTAR
jgi:hypothetical protein